MDRKQKLLNDILYQLRHTDYFTMKATYEAVCNINKKRGLNDEPKRRTNTADHED